jgi:hypothetical protein
VLALRLTRGEAPDPEAIRTAAAAVTRPVLLGISNALREFTDAPSAKTARNLLSELRDAPGARPPRKPRKTPSRHRIALQATRERQRGLAQSRLDSDYPLPVHWFAADALATSGGRVHVKNLLELAGDPGTGTEVRRVAVRSAATLLAREIDAAEPGPALEKLKGWWRERAFALEVPVLPHGSKR